MAENERTCKKWRKRTRERKREIGRGKPTKKGKKVFHSLVLHGRIVVHASPF